MATLELRAIPSVSPTLAEIMRVCHLRAALARAKGASRFVLGTPKAWLGTAYHYVMERIARLDHSRESIQQSVERLWNEAIAIQEQRASTHPLDQRFGKAENWPGYCLARASVEIRARELPAPGNISSEGPSNGCDFSLEEELTAFGGKLVGRPDVIRGDEIRDYKSGSITEFSEEVQKEVVKAAYVRQLKIYGFLVEKEFGACPSRGVLVPLGGAPVEIALQPRDCEREASEAVALIDSHNSKINSSGGISGLASPSPQNCKWCPFKSICPRFWDDASPSWSGQLEGDAVEGNIVTDPKPIHEGCATAVTVAVTRGTRSIGILQIAPLTLQIHGDASRFHAGDAIRITGLGNRMDGTVVPTQRTVVIRAQDIPSLALPASI